MQKIFVVAVILIVAGYSAYACNCGGGGSFSGGGSLGMMSQYNQNFVGLAWEHNGVDSRSSIYGKYNSSFQFNTVHLMGKYYPVRRMFISADVPYHFKMNDEKGTIQNVNGIGDLTLSAGYMVLKPVDSLCKVWTQYIVLSGGVKMPTGKYKVADEGISDGPYLQPGTGSWDVMFNVGYTFKYKRFGVFSELSYAVNTTNKQDYKFGNRLSSSASGFYRNRVGGFTFLPSAGMLFENLQKDRLIEEPVQMSGGNILFATFGLDVYYKWVGLGFYFLQPTYQQISDDYAKSQSRWLLNALISF